MIIDPRLQRIVAAQPYPLLFATISGAHLYGFPSPDSDFDLRGAHVLALEKTAGLGFRDETVEDSRVIEGLEVDIVMHRGFGRALAETKLPEQPDYEAANRFPIKWWREMATQNSKLP